MFGLTTKLNKMQKQSINHESPAIGNVLLYAVFLHKLKYRCQILQCVKMMNAHYLIVAGGSIAHRANMLKAIKSLNHKLMKCWMKWNVNFISNHLTKYELP